MKKVVSLALILCLLFFSTGCWSRKEIENLAIFTLLAVDRITEDGEEKWQISARVMHPPSQGGAQGGTPSGKETQEYLFKGTGRTLLEARFQFMNRIPRLPFLGHLSAVIIGERAAREKVGDIIEIMERFRESRPLTYVMVTHGEAYKLLLTGSEISPSLSREIKDLIEISASKTGKSCVVNAAAFAAWMLSPDRDAVASDADIFVPEESKEGETRGPQKTVILDGMAVFRGDKLAGWLNEYETAGYSIITKPKLSSLQIPVVVRLGEYTFTFLVSKTKRKLKVQTAGDKIAFSIDIKANGVVVDPNGLETDPERLAQAEEASAEAIRAMAQSAVDKSKELNSEFLGLAQELHRKNPAKWHELGSGWREAIREAEVEIKVKAKIGNTGRSTKKFKIKKE